MILIGIGSKARQGKDIVASVWKEAIPELKKYSFAEEIKLYCRDHHDQLLPEWQRHHQTKHMPFFKEDSIYNYPAILQWYGKWAQDKDENVWIRKVAEKLAADSPPIAAITDVRYILEAQFVRANGGFMVEVLRKNPAGSRYIDPTRDPFHPTETGLDDYTFDYTITARSGDLVSLKTKALGVLKNIVSSCANVDGDTNDYIVF